MIRNRKWIVTLLMLILMMMPLNAQAASQKARAIQAYKQFLQEASIEWDSNWTVKSSHCYFGLAYLNNDTVPELIVRNSQDLPHVGGYGRIYTYKNGKVLQIAKLYMNISRFSYYKKKGVYIDTYVQGGVTKWYLKLSGNNTVRKLSTFTNTAKMSWLPKGTSYYKNTGMNQKITKSVFNRELKKLVGNKKIINVTLRKNTKTNQKKYLK